MHPGPKSNQKRERIYIIFRWAGVFFGLIVLLIFASGFVFVSARALTQLLGITLLVAGVVALIQSNENLRGVEIISCRSSPVAAGEDAILELALRNFSERERIGLCIRSGWRVRPYFSAWLPVLDAHTTARVELRIPTSKRGRFEVPSLWVCSVMPMGLCFTWKVFSACGQYFVYPRPRGRSLHGMASAGDGWRGRNAGRGEDVTDHRPYTPGDLLSRLNWRVFARTGSLLVRTIEQEESGDAVLRWEDTAFLQDEENRLEQLSFWIVECLKEGRSFTMTLPNALGDLSSRNVAACRSALAVFGDFP